MAKKYGFIAKLSPDEARVALTRLVVRSMDSLERKFLENYKREKRRTKYRQMLGNTRNYPGHNLRERVLLTVRRDALKIRESILNGESKLALEETDWLIDRVDNSLAEGC